MGPGPGCWLGVALGFAGGVVGYAGWRWVHPPRLPWPSGAEGTPIEFASPDGTRLRGLWLGEGEGPTVVLCHGYFRSLAEPYDVGLALWRAGYRVLLFDFRACGRSDGYFTTLGAREVLDVLAAVEEACRRGGGPLAVLGISMGAAAAIMAAAREPRVRAVVADSAYADLADLVAHRVRAGIPLPPLRPLARASVRLGELLAAFRAREVRPVDWIACLAPRPLLLIYAERDSFVPLHQREEMFQRAGEPKEMWVAPGSDHAMARWDYPQEYRERVLSFLARALSA